MNLQEYYQTIYWGHDRRPAVISPISVHARRLQQIILCHISKAEKLIDVGCGDGHYYGHFLQELTHVHVGADVSPLALQAAQKIGIKGLMLDIEKPLPFPTNCFEAAICIDVLEHLFNGEYLTREINRVLKPGCFLIASVPNIAHYPHRLRLLGGKFVAGGLAATVDTPWRDPHIRFFTVKSLKNLMLQAGFRKVKIYGGYSAFLVRMPFVSVILEKLIGWAWLQKISDIFEPLGYKWPSLFAGRIVVVACKP